MKLAVIGGSGLIGSTTAFLAAQKGIFDEIRLLGRRRNMVLSHAMDMEHALLPFSETRVRAAEYDGIGDCDVIFITAGAPERAVATRDEYLKDNLKIIDEIAENLDKYNKDGIVLIATNPIDVFNYYLYRKLCRSKSRMLGFSANDSLRLKWAVSREFGLEFDRLEGYCIGEHGEGQVPLMNLIRYDGRPFAISEEKKPVIKNRLLEWFRDFQRLDSKRTSGWTSSVTAVEILGAIATDSGKIIECSVPLEGELGYYNVSVGMPVSLGLQGVKEIIVPELTADEKGALDAAVGKIKAQLESIS
ncbi:MAG TPA: hypothetical protein VN580_09295 [Clostridia bacterium]|nr:hypothetical protein [Clostridia bacterium]